MQVVDVQRRPGGIDEALEELAHQVHVEVTDSCTRVLDPVLEAGSAGEVDDDSRQRFVERHVSVPVAGDAALVAECFGEGLAEHDAGIFHRVMGVDGEIAAGAHVQVEQAVARHLVEHVLEKRHAGLEVAFADAIEIERDGDLRLPCIALD